MLRQACEAFATRQGWKIFGHNDPDCATRYWRNVVYSWIDQITLDPIHASLIKDRFFS
jgi:hypothetical protein